MDNGAVVKDPPVPTKPRLWCPKLRCYILKGNVANHMEDWHGVNRKMVRRVYGGPSKYRPTF
jgi:hypothetical protein